MRHASRQLKGGRPDASLFSLFPLWRADDVLVRDRFVVALLLALEIQIADAEAARAIIDAENAAFLLMPRRNEAVFAGLLFDCAFAAAIAGRDSESARPNVGSIRVVGELAGDDVSRQLIQSVDKRQIDLRRREKLVLACNGRRRRRACRDRRDCRRRSFPQHRSPQQKPNHFAVSLAEAAAKRQSRRSVMRSRSLSRPRSNRRLAGKPVGRRSRSPALGWF